MSVWPRREKPGEVGCEKESRAGQRLLGREIHHGIIGFDDFFPEGNRYVRKANVVPWFAVDILGREVAFALINAECLDDTSRTRIQREDQAMVRLGSHPHIVTVFDLGQEQAQPYMVTELRSGGDV